MPTYIDIHDLPGVTAEDIAKAHERDIGIQDKYGVNYFKYWLNKEKGKAYCMCTAPNADAANMVHRQSHGLVATRIMEVDPAFAEVFMGSAEVNDAGAALQPNNHQHDPGTRTVLFTDIVESTNMTQRLGDETAMTLLEVHNRIVRAALAENGGREVKHTGDGIMAAFTSAGSAVHCAIAIQHELQAYRKKHTHHPLQVRIGLAAGEPIEHDNDFFGAAVQLAARICSHADPEQILVSNAVAELCIGKAIPLRDMGQVELKGFPQPVHVHCIGLAKKSA